MFRTRSMLSATALQLTLALPLALAPLAPAEAGKKDCPAAQVFVRYITMRHQKPVEPEPIREEFAVKFKQALGKEGFLLAGGEEALGGGDVSLDVVVRAWTSRSPSGRVTLELAARVAALDGSQRLWSGEVNPGGMSRMLNMRNSDPKNLAKKAAELVAEACERGWQPDPR